MSAQDLVFTTTVDTNRIFDPLQLISAGVTSVTVTNQGTDDLTNLGLYLVPATNIGSVDYPAHYPPESDYQDLLEWGTSVDLGVTVAGGLKVVAPQNAGTFNGYFSRTNGARYDNRIRFIDLAAGASATFTLELETPPAVASRRLYVNVVLE